MRLPAVLDGEQLLGDGIAVFLKRINGIMAIRVDSPSFLTSRPEMKISIGGIPSGVTICKA